MKVSIYSFLFLSFLAFSSCGDGFDFDGEKDFDKEYEKDYDKGDDKEDCFALIYPVSYIMPDGTIISGDEETLDAAIKTWYEAHPDSKEEFKLEYPVQIIDKKGETVDIDNEDEMILAKADCGGETGICEWDGSKVSDTSIWEEYIVEPIVTNEDCGCIVSGVVKYVKIGTHFAYVIYYGKGECDNWAHLVTYFESDEVKDKVEKCKFELDCDLGG